MVYGVPQTINCANYIYFFALRELQQLTNVHDSVIKIFTGTESTESDPDELDELINLHRGQGMELYWRDRCICPTEQEYSKIYPHRGVGTALYDRRSNRRFLLFSKNKNKLEPYFGYFGAQI